MFTTCPNCALNLAVTAADLRVGQGYVRCGRCVSVFNALISLADEAEVGPEEARVEDTASATQSRPVPEDLKPPEPPVPPEALATPDPGDSTGQQAPPMSDGGLELVDESRDMSTGTFETIVLEGDAILQTEEFIDESEVDEQLKALAEQLGDHDVTRFPEQEAQNEPDVALESAAPRRAPRFVTDGVADDRAEYEVPAETAAEPPVDAFLAPRPRRRVSKWLLASVGLAVLLAGQALHHWRYPLAERLPFIGSVYAGIGAPLRPQWSLAAYDVRQLGAAADPADARRIEVRASVRNTANAPQPAPVLRIVLQDRFGNELARHERAPADYLRGTAVEMLAADQRVDASFFIDDPEQKAEGFEIDACLRDAGGALRCAAEATPPRR